MEPDVQNVYEYLKVGMVMKDIKRETQRNDMAIVHQMAQAIEMGHPVCTKKFGLAFTAVREIEEYILGNGRCIPPMPELAQKTKKNLGQCRMAVALIKLRFGQTEIFDLAQQKQLAGTSRAIQRHLAPSSRPALATNAFNPPRSRWEFRYFLRNNFKRACVSYP